MKCDVYIFEKFVNLIFFLNIYIIIVIIVYRFFKYLYIKQLYIIINKFDNYFIFIIFLLIIISGLQNELTCF